MNPPLISAAAKYMTLEVNPLQASLKIIEPLPHNLKDEDVYQLLSLNGIKFGILYEEIKNLIILQPREQVVIARATPSVNGKDAFIEEILNIDADASPLLMENDKMDYKSIESYCMVNKGETIAIKHPLTPGTPGKSIMGEELPPIPGKDVDLPAGENTLKTENNSRLLAGATGYLYRTRSSINIGTTLVIEGDVDLSTGHIKYSGDLVIKGNVQPGFKVDASGNILIFGDVESADIWSRSGSVEIRKSVFGKNNCKVFAKKNIRLDFATQSKLTAENKIFFNKYLLNCETLAFEGIYSSGTESCLFGGVSTSYKSINVHQLGNKSELKTRVEIHSLKNDELEEKLASYKNLEIKLNKHVARATASLKESNKSRQSDKTPEDERKLFLKRQIVEYRETLVELKLIQAKIKTLEMELGTLEELSGTIRAGTVYPKAELTFGKKRKTIEKLQNKAVFYFENNTIKG